jgi:hypothetical protein
LAGLAGGYGNIGYMGPGLALAMLGSKAAAPTALMFCCDSIFLFSIVPLLIALSFCDRPAKRHLDRARIRRRADRNIRVRHHAHQRDVVHSNRPACVSVPRRPP